MVERIERIISLSVGTTAAEDWFKTFQQISEIATALDKSEDFTYISVSSTVAGTDDGSEGDPDGLYYDDKTLDKVRRALWVVLANKSEGIPASVITDMITEMQNEGIFFRERR
jgi:hypothetical protein